MFCPACGKEHEAADKFCRHCARQLNTDPHGPSQTSVQVTARNPYQGKKNQIWGNVMAWPGLFMALLGAAAFDPPRVFVIGAGLLFFVVGIIVYSVGRFEHWYHAE